MTIRNDVLVTVAVMAEDSILGENTIVERLIGRGYDRLRAELLVAFVPLGLARALITRTRALPPIHLSKIALIQEGSDGSPMEVVLAEIPEFKAALQLGEETFTTGIIPREEFRAASLMSVELSLIDAALRGNADLRGATMAPPILLRLAEAPGFEQWYRSLS